MPDKDGWEIQPRPLPQIWHADCDGYADNTPAGRAAHLKECRRTLAERKKADEARRQREATAVLRAVNRERRLERQVLGQ